MRAWIPIVNEASEPPRRGSSYQHVEPSGHSGGRPPSPPAK